MKKIIGIFALSLLVLVNVSFFVVALPTRSFAINETSTINASKFVGRASPTGNQIHLEATITGLVSDTDGWNFSFVCGANENNMEQTVSYSLSAAEMTNPVDVEGTLDIVTPYQFVTESTPYYCRMVDGSGSDVTDDILVSAGSGELDVPYVSNIKDVTAVVSINHGSGTFSPYLYYGNSPDSLTSSRVTMTLPAEGSTFSTQISGLRANTPYYYQVFNGVTGDAMSDIKSFTTLTDMGTTVTAPKLEVIHGTIPKTLNTSQYTKDGFVNCGKGIPQGNKIADACDFGYLLKLIDKFIGYLIFIIAPGVAALTLAYGGFLYATSGINAENKGAAKGMITNALVGWILAFAAWIIVKFVMVQLGYASDSAAGWLTFW